MPVKGSPLPATSVVVSAGAINSAALLLRSANDRHPDGQLPSHRAGALYDLVAPNASKRLQPVGEWNTSRIVLVGNHGEHWLNGKRVVSLFGRNLADKVIVQNGIDFEAIPVEVLGGWEEDALKIVEHFGRLASLRSFSDSPSPVQKFLQKFSVLLQRYNAQLIIKRLPVTSF